MAFSHTDLAALSSAFAAYCAERQMGDQQIRDYLFDVLHRPPADQRKERREWVRTEQRHVQRLQDSQQDRVAAETANLQGRKDRADAIAAKVDAEGNGAGTGA